MQIPDEKVWEGAWEAAKAFIGGAILIFLRSISKWFRNNMDWKATTEKRVAKLEDDVSRLTKD